MIYQLTKQETEEITSQLALISHYQKVVDALQTQFRVFALSNIFPRLELPTEKMEGATFDINSGTLNIPDPKPEEKPTPEKVG